MRLSQCLTGLAASATIGLCAAAPVAAQGSAVCLTVERALELADRHDPRIQQAAAKKDAAGARRRQVRSAWLPQVSLFGRGGMGDGALADNQVDNRHGMRLVQKVFDFGAGKYGRKSADAALDAATQGAERTRLETAVEVGRAFFDVLRAQERLAAFDAFTEHAARQDALTDMRLEQSTITRVEASQLRADFARLQAERSQQAIVLAAAGQRLERLTGEPLGCLDESAAAEFVQSRMPASLEEAEAAAAEFHPGRKELAASVTQAGFEVTQNERQKWPVLDFNAIYTNDFDSFRNKFRPHHRAGLDLDLPVLRGGRSKADVDLAKSQLRAATASYDQYVSESRERLQMGWRRRNELEQVHLRRLDIRDQRLEANLAVELEIGLGTATVDDVIDIQRGYLQAVLDEIDGRYDMYDQDLLIAAEAQNLAVPPSPGEQADR